MEFLISYFSSILTKHLTTNIKFCNSHIHADFTYVQILQTFSRNMDRFDSLRRCTLHYTLQVFIIASENKRMVLWRNLHCHLNWHLILKKIKNNKQYQVVFATVKMYCQNIHVCIYIKLINMYNELLYMLLYMHIIRDTIYTHNIK